MKTLEIDGVKINEKDDLFIIPCGGGFSCLGFDVLETRATRLGSELVSKFGYSVRQPEPRGTLARYAQYLNYVGFARAKNEACGWQSKSELTPQLIGLEGKRVEVRHKFKSGEVETTRFYVGKSTGFIPCHLEIKRCNSSGGGAVCLGEIISVQAI